jgi:hypothetical protein
MVLALRKSLPKNWLRLTDHYEQNKFGQAITSKSPLPPTTSNTQGYVSSFTVDKPLRIRVNQVTNLNNALESTGFKAESKGLLVCVAVGVYHSDHLIREIRTEEFKYNGGNPPSWNVWFDVTPYKTLTQVIHSIHSNGNLFILQASILHIVVWCRPTQSSKKPTPVCWVNFPLMDYRNVVSQGYKDVRLWVTEPDPTGKKILLSLYK